MSTPPPRIAYVSFPAAGGAQLIVAGKLSLPVADSRIPAVVICHGSDGVDGRGQFHAAALNARGVATLEVDMWAARGNSRGAAARPSSPVETLPDAFGALGFLRHQPEIDPTRIGVMGFSWGGVVTLLASTRRHAAIMAPEPGFAAHTALYPVCWAYGRVPALSLADRTGAPILIQTGDEDAYDPPGAPERLVGALRRDGSPGEVTHIHHPGAGHGFDRDLPTQVIDDPFAHEGRGGAVTMAFNPAAAQSSRSAAVEFFLRTLV
jgi:dienelactone hydrolase